MKNKKILEILQNFKNRKVIVVGDVMLDKSIIGHASKISPEAPVPVVAVTEEIYLPGGAANVAANISSLEGKVSLFGFVGNDESGEILSGIMEERKIKYFFGKSSKTTLKVRIRARNQQLLRVDSEECSLKNFNSTILELMTEEINSSDIILVSDYGKGSVNSSLMNFLKSSGKKIIIDPKPQNTALYRNSFLITPNEDEALEMSEQKEIYSAGRNLVEKLNCNVIVTRGKNGMTLFSDGEIDIPTFAKEVYDVTGAGDTVAAAISLALVSGANIEEAAIIANYAAGISVSKIGTYQVKLSELEQEIFGEKKFEN